MPTDRSQFLTSAIKLSYVTIAWNLTAGAITTAAAVTSGSLSLAGFGLNALVDTAASAALVWRFKKEVRDPVGAEVLERRAEMAIGAAMGAAAVYLGAQGTHALFAGTGPHASTPGIVVTGASILFLPGLARAKARVARQLGSRALRGDSVLTAASAALGILTLSALVASELLDWWWSDAAAALVIAAALGTEAVRAELESRRA